MEGTTEKDCSPLWSLYQQIVSDMKNSAPMWEEFISKATKLHSALKSALVAIASFLDAFQKIADAATNARGATKEIGTALTRVCLRHRAIEGRMKTFISTLMETLISPLSERADEWRRGGCATGALSREHARECKRARAELRRRVQDAQRHVRKARRAAPDAKRRADVCMQDVQERKQQLEEMEEKAVKAALIEERSRFCHFVSLLSPVVESEVAMLAEVGHLQEGGEQLIRQTGEPRTLPPASLQVICDVKSCYSGWAEGDPHSPGSSSRLGSRKSSLTSISSLNSQCSDHNAVSSSTVSCSTPISNASSAGTLPPSNEIQRRSQGSDNQSVSSECASTRRGEGGGGSGGGGGGGDGDGGGGGAGETCALGSTASATWPDLKDTAQFERAASAILAGRPHTISAAYERGHPRPALSVHTFASEMEVRDTAIYARPPLPTRCSSLERPQVPAKVNANTGQHDLRISKPSSLPPHLAKEMPQALYVNMSELASLAAARAPLSPSTSPSTSTSVAASSSPAPTLAPATASAPADHAAHHQEKVCSESSASESSLESSSGYGSQGAFAAEDQALQHQLQHTEGGSVIVTLRRSLSVAAARDSFSVSLGSLEEAVRGLDEACEVPYATVGKPAVPKRRPLSLANNASAWSRRGSSSSVGKPPPPIRRTSSISRPQRSYVQGNPQSPQVTDADNLPPPPAFLLQPDHEANNSVQQTSVAETVKQLTELKHMPASPGLVRRGIQHQNHNQNLSQGQILNQGQNLNQTQPSLSSFQQTRNISGSNTSLNSTPNLNPIYGQTGHRIMQYVEQNNLYGRKSSLNSSVSDIYREAVYGETTGQNNCFSSFRSAQHYDQTGYAESTSPAPAQDRGIYAAPLQSVSPLTARRLRPHSADRRRPDQSSLIASLSAKLAPQLSPRTTRRALSSITPADPPNNKAKGAVSPTTTVQPAFLDKLSAALQLQQRRRDALAHSSRAGAVRDIINEHAQPDPRASHTSLMEQIKRGATLRRNKQCNDRSAPKIR